MKLAQLALVCLVATTTAALVARADDDDDDTQATEATIKAEEMQKQALFAKKKYDETGYVRRKEPKPGEWLFRFKESGQDADTYKKECDNKKSKDRDKIYVTEMGTLGKRAKAVAPEVRDFLHAFYQLEVKTLDPEKPPPRAWKAERKQYDADVILKGLKNLLEDDALVCVALLDEDLFTPGLNFVFGEGSLAQKVGAYSFHRFGGDDVEDALYKKRCFKLVAHEVGHILGMEHCIYYECVMNGANSLDEDDKMPLHLCPVCLEKVKWNVGFDELVREKDIEKVLSTAKIEEEAAWSKKRIERLSAKK